MVATLRAAMSTIEGVQISSIGRNFFEFHGDDIGQVPALYSDLPRRRSPPLRYLEPLSMPSSPQKLDFKAGFFIGWSSVVNCDRTFDKAKISSKVGGDCLHSWTACNTTRSQLRAWGTQLRERTLILVAGAVGVMRG